MFDNRVDRHLCLPLRPRLRHLFVKESVLLVGKERSRVLIAR